MRGALPLVTVATLGFGGCNWVFELDEVTAGGPAATFEAHAAELGRAPTDFAIGDLDHDGVPEVVVATGDNTLHVIRNRLDGGEAFVPSVTKHSLEAARRFVTLGLIRQPDSDDPELLLLDTAGSGVRVANAAGTLSTSSVSLFNVPAGSQLLIDAGDPASLDGGTVLVATPASRAVSTYRVLVGVATPQAGATLARPFVTWTAARLNPDELNDVVIALDGGVGGYLRQPVSGPNGPFGPVVQIFDSLTAPITGGALSPDESGDLVARIRDQSAVLILFGDGAGGFPRQTEVTLGFAPSALAVLDADADGISDLCATGQLGANTLVQIIRTGADGSFTPEAPQTVPGQLVKLTTSDFDRDGRADLGLLLALSPTAGQVVFLLQR